MKELFRTYLAEKSDPLWDLAYRLLIVENYARHEVIERLSLGEPQRERWFIEEVVTTIPDKVSKRTSVQGTIDRSGY